MDAMPTRGKHSSSDLNSRQAVAEEEQCSRLTRQQFEPALVLRRLELLAADEMIQVAPDLQAQPLVHFGDLGPELTVVLLPPHAQSLLPQDEKPLLLALQVAALGLLHAAGVVKEPLLPGAQQGRPAPADAAWPRRAIGRDR